MRCPSCKHKVVPIDTRNTKVDWKCIKCRRLIPDIKVYTLCEAIQSEANLLEPDEANPRLCDVPAHEKFIEKFSQVLHPSHGFLVKVKYNLARMYGRMAGFECDKLSDIQLKRKHALCVDVLGVLDKIMPKLSSMRGVMLYEAHLPCVLLANR